MKVGIVTYDVPHLKTQEVFFKLHNKKKYEIIFFVSKFKKFKKREVLFKHRPFQFKGVDIFKIAKKYNIEIQKIENINKFKSIKFFLICGSGIINSKLIVKNKFINCHSGLIPMSRGLDSFKWSILKNRILGNTLHFIDKNVDLGKIIFQKKTPILKSDNFQRLAKRHYNIEIEMLVNFESYVQKPRIFKLKKNEPSMRMPIYLEREMFKNFKRFKKKFLKL